MELFETLLVTFFAGGAPGAIWAVIQFLIHLLINVTLIYNSMQRSALDRYIAKHGWCSTRMFDYSRTPDEGFHIVITHRGMWPTGILVAHKWCDEDGCERYTLYYSGRGVEDIRRQVIGDPNAITILNVYVASPTRISVDSSQLIPPAKEKAWQKIVVDQIVSAYASHGRASFLVCGYPGCGKSTLGILVAKRLHGVGVIPEVIANADLTTPGLLLEDLYSRPTVSTPIILMLDEYDCAADYAERDTSKSNSSGSIALANTPTLLLSTIDQMARTQNLVVIATSNLPLKKMRADPYARYTRIGRLDMWYEVPNKTKTNG